MTRHYHTYRLPNNYVVQSAKHTPDKMRLALAIALIDGVNEASRRTGIAVYSVCTWKQAALCDAVERPTIVSRRAIRSIRPVQEARPEPVVTVPLAVQRRELRTSEREYRDALPMYFVPGARLEKRGGAYYTLVANREDHHVPAYLAAWVRTELAYVEALAGRVHVRERRAA